MQHGVFDEELGSELNLVAGPAGAHAPWYRETDGGDEPRMASSADGVWERWLVNNTAAPSNFLSAVKVSGSWTCGFLKIAAGLT